MRSASYHRPAALFALSTAAVLASALVPDSDLALGANFTKIADKNTLIPGGQWSGQNFSSFATGLTSDFVLPGVDGGHVVFLGQSSTSGSGNGVYKWDNGVLGLVADPSTPRPGGGNFSQLDHPSVNGPDYAFRADPTPFKTTQGSLTSVGNIFTKTGPLLDGGSVWLNSVTFTPSPGQAPIYHVQQIVGGLAQTFVTSGDAVPLPPALGARFSIIDGNVVGRNGKAVFWAQIDNLESGGHFGSNGLYRVADGSVERIVDGGMLGFTGGIDRVGFDFDGDSTAFFSGGTLYLESGGVFQAVAVSGQPAPGGGIYSMYNNGGSSSIDDGHIAFGSASGGFLSPVNAAIYSDLDGPIQRVVGTGDSLFGQTVENVMMGSEANGIKLTISPRRH